MDSYRTKSLLSNDVLIFRLLFFRNAVKWSFDKNINLFYVSIRLVMFFVYLLPIEEKMAVESFLLNWVLYDVVYFWLSIVFSWILSAEWKIHDRPLWYHKIIFDRFVDGVLSAKLRPIEMVRGVRNLANMPLAGENDTSQIFLLCYIY